MFSQMFQLMPGYWNPLTSLFLKIVSSVWPPGPVGGYTETILRLIDVIFQAPAQLPNE